MGDRLIPYLVVYQKIDLFDLGLKMSYIDNRLSLGVVVMTAAISARLRRFYSEYQVLSKQ